MPEWTPQQRSAIDARGRSIIVSAAAGSGKTAVLVERLLAILSDSAHPVPADQIIVVTFTNDAAAQMKQRLSAAITLRLSGLPEDAEEYAWLLEQRMRLPAAKISTIHSFCFDLIRENADVLDISPAFLIAETGQESICQRHALDTVMEQWTSHKPEMQILYDHFCAKDDSDLEKLLLAVADYLASTAFPAKWLADARRLAGEGNALFERMRETACTELRGIIALYEKAVPFADKALPGKDASANKFRLKTDTDLADLRAQLDYLETSPQETLCNAPDARSCAFQRFPNLSKNVDETYKLALQQICEIARNRYREHFVPNYLEPLRFFPEDAAVTAKVVPLLLELTEAYLEALREEKRARNLLAFSDAEELTLRLLAEVQPDGTLTRTPLAVQLSEQYALLMVDEYQDTNNKQDSIFKLLSHGMHMDENGLHYGDNAFLVGDVKQSIYSFRQANPENFRRVIAESTPLAQEPDGMALIRLNQNFRSAPGVLDFVNALFLSVMHRDCGEVDYTPEEQLHFGSRTYSGFQARTQVLLARGTEDMPPGTDLQAECTADTIASMIGKTPVLIPGPDGTVTTRPAVPDDFCILLRSVTGSGEAFMEALRRRHIGVTADTDSGLLCYPEIHLIRSLLRIADNPMTDTAMAAVMLSPVGGFTAEDLAQLKCFSRQHRLFRQMQELESAEHPGSAFLTLQTKVQRFLADVHDLQETVVRYPLEEAVWEFYSLTDLLALQSMFDDAAQRRARLDAFARLAGDYRRNAALTSQSCLSGWLRYLDRLEEGGNDLEVKGVPAQSGCVRIKTIHKSKGLQFPFVFAAGLDRKFSSNPSGAAIHAGEDGLLGVRIYDRETCLCSETAAYSHLCSDVYRRQTSEELRLFYVALTRAEQQLFLVMDNPEGGKTVKASPGKLGGLLDIAPEIAQLLAPYAKSMQDWVLYFLLSCKDRFHMEQLLADKESSGAFADYRLWHYHPAETAAPEQLTVTAKPDPKALAALRRQLAFTYETPQSSLVSKYSVTELCHAGSESEERMERPDFTLEGTTGGLANLKGAERGTAVHKIMQLIDFALAAQDIEAALQALLDAGRITKSEYSCIDSGRLAAFFRSPIYRRIAAADRIERERKIFVMIGSMDREEIAPLTEDYRGTDGVMIGTMDLLFHEPGGWVILDYKTDHTTSGDALLREYRSQLLLYRAAAEQILGEPVTELYLYAFSLDQALQLQ